MALKLRLPDHMLYAYGGFCQRIKIFCFITTSRSYNVAFLKRYRFFTFITCRYQGHGAAERAPEKSRKLKKMMPMLQLCLSAETQMLMRWGNRPFVFAQEMKQIKIVKINLNMLHEYLNFAA
jgi:hypothetical protein